MQHPIQPCDYAVLTTANITRFFYKIRLILDDEIIVSSSVNSDGVDRNFVLKYNLFSDKWQLQGYLVKHNFTFQTNPLRLSPQQSPQIEQLKLIGQRDIDINILLLLDFPSIVNVFAVNSYFYEFSKDERLWELLLERDFSEIKEHQRIDGTTKRYYLFLISNWNNYVESNLLSFVRYNNIILFQEYYDRYIKYLKKSDSDADESDYEDVDSDDDADDYEDCEVKLKETIRNTGERCQQEALSSCSIPMIEHIGNHICHLEGMGIISPAIDDRIYISPYFPDIIIRSLEQGLTLPHDIFKGIFYHLIRNRDNNEIQVINREIILLLLSNKEYRMMYDYGYYCDVIDKSIAEGYIEFLEFMVKNDITTITFIFSEKRFEEGIYNGDVNLIKFYLSHCYNFATTKIGLFGICLRDGDGDQVNVLYSNSIPMMELYIEEGMIFTPSCVIQVLNTKKLSINSLKWLHRHGVKITSAHFDVVIKTENNELIEWFKKKRITLSDKSLLLAVEAYYPVMVDWILSTGFPLSDRVVRNIVRSDSSDLLDVLKKHGVKFTKEHANLAFLYSSCGSTRWLEREGIVQDIIPVHLISGWICLQPTLDLAVRRGDLNTIRYHGDNGIFPYACTISLVVKRGYIDMLDYLADKGVLPSEVDVEDAEITNKTIFLTWWKSRTKSIMKK